MEEKNIEKVENMLRTFGMVGMTAVVSAVVAIFAGKVVGGIFAILLVYFALRDEGKGDQRK